MYKVGLYEREITPLFGNNLCGYFNPRPVSGVKDKTYAKAIVISDGDKIFAMLAIDSCELGKCTIEKIKSRVTSLSDISGDDILVSSTHSHTAAPGSINPPKETAEIDAFYLDWLALSAADAILCAYAKMEEATIKYTEARIEGTTFVRNYLMRDGSARTNPGVNNPDIVRALDTPDTTAPVLIFEDKNGKALGAIYSFANHQDSVDGTEVSADWSGVVAKRMKEKYGMDFVTIFFLGTAGNINQTDVHSKDPSYTPESCYKELGEAAFAAIEKSLAELREVSGGISVVNSEKVYKTRIMTPEELAEQEKILEKTPIPENMKLDASSPKELFFACMAERAITHTKTAPREITVKFQIIKLSSILIFALPGEVYSQFGRRIKEAFPNHKCFFACLANNDWSYMPTKESYLPGLYESLYGSAKFYPGDTEDIFDSFIELGKSLI